jgi:hypothetical protein
MTIPDPRVQILVDRLAIQDLIHSYNLAIDTRNATLFETLFLPDCVCGSMQGREAIIGALRSTGTKYTSLNHLTTSLRIEIDGDRAHANSKSIVNRRPVADENQSPLIIVEYTDDIRRDGSAWKFARRTIQTLEP